LKKYFVVHTSTVIALIFGVINQLILVSFLPSSDYGYLAATIGVGLIPVMMTVTNQTNILFDYKKKIINNEFNPWSVFVFFLFIALLVSFSLFFFIIDNIVSILVFILCFNIFFTSALEFVSALFIVQEINPKYIALSQLSNTLPRTIIYITSFLITSQIDLNTVAIAALTSFLFFAFIVKDQVTFKRKLFNISLFKIGRIESMKYGLSNLFLTFINQSPILISLRTIGPEFSGTIAFSLYVFNFLWNVPADIYKRYRLNYFHQFIRKNNGIKNLFSYKELCLITIIAITISIFSYFIFSSQFISVIIESFKESSSYLILILLIGLPSRYASIYLSSLLLNSLYTKYRTISYTINLFIAIILYSIGSFFLSQYQYVQLIVLIEFIMFLTLFIIVKALIKNEKNIN